MKALYSLVCCLRTLYALTQGTVTLVLRGPTALAPAQWLLFGCGLGIALRILIPAPTSGGGRQFAFLDRGLSAAAVVSVVALTASDLLDSCAWVGRFVLGL